MDGALRQEIHELHAKICAGLADPNRILILYALSDSPRHVNELAELIEAPQPTVSRHLAVLRDRGLVESVREGQSVTYSLADRRIIEALDLMRGVLADRLRARADLAELAAPGE